MTKKKPAKPAPKKRGRPSLYTDSLAAKVCAQLATGKPLTHICRDDPSLPSDDVVRRWADSRPAFASDFAQARARGYDAIAQECLDIADETTRDTITVGSGDNERDAANAEWISRSKLRVETRLKLLAKWDPKRYGERMDLHHTGSIDLAGRLAAAREREKT